jgi:hypothetical protein
MDVTTGIPQTSLAVRIYSPTKGSKPDQALPNVVEGARVGCSNAGPGGNILISASSPVMNVNDLKVN